MNVVWGRQNERLGHGKTEVRSEEPEAMTRNALIGVRDMAGKSRPRAVAGKTFSLGKIF